MAKTASKKSATEKASNAMAKKPAGENASTRHRAFKITLTAVYKDADIDENAISDDAFKAMSNVSKGLALLHIDSVKKIANAGDLIAKIMVGVSSQTKDSMTRKKTDDGKEFIAVDEKGKSKEE